MTPAGRRLERALLLLSWIQNMELFVQALRAEMTQEVREARMAVLDTEDAERKRDRQHGGASR